MLHSSNLARAVPAIVAQLFAIVRPVSLPARTPHPALRPRCLLDDPLRHTHACMHYYSVLRLHMKYKHTQYRQVGFHLRAQ